MVGPPGGAPGWISLTEQAAAAKSEKNGDRECGVGRGEDGERKRKKNENGRDVGLYPGISSWRERVVERDHPRAL